MKIVIDTSILIDLLRGGERWNEFLEEVEKRNLELFIPTIVIYELFSGKSSKDPHVKSVITNLVRDYKRIELTELIAIKAGELSRETTSNIGVSDYIIAASALEIGGTVLTLNKKHFAQIPGLPIYPI